MLNCNTLIRQGFSIALVLCLGLSISGIAPAQVYVKAGSVGGDGSSGSPYATIQEGITNLGSETEIRCTAGTYTGEIDTVEGLTLSGGWADDFAAQDIAGNLSELDGESTSRTRALVDVLFDNVVIEGFTIKNCVATDGYGAALYTRKIVTLTDCILKDNLMTGATGGGAIGAFNYIGVVMTLTNCDFINNTSEATAGGNHQYGSAIFMKRGVIEANNCRFLDNNGRGAVYISHYGDNPATNAATFTNCIFANNEVNLYQAGAIYVLLGNLNVVNCTFYANDAVSYANDIYSGNADDVINIYNSIFDGGTGTAANRQIWGNYAAATLNLSNNLFHDTSYGGYGVNGGDPDIDSGNINSGTTDPLFGDAASLDFSIGAGSAAIDTGVDSAVDITIPSVDMAGNARPQDGDGDTTATCDIGAYEATTLSVNDWLMY